MNNIISFIKTCLMNFLKKQSYYNENIEQDIIVSKIRIKNQGDFSTNLAFIICKKYGKKLPDLTNEIKDFCLKEYTNYFSNINVVKGFINFYINNNFYKDIISNVLRLKENYGKTPKKNIKYSIEMISANPTGPLHLGHGRNAFISNTVANILEFDGYEVTKEYYVNDAGNQINNLALTIYFYYLKLNKDIPENFELPENCYKGEIYNDLAKIIFNKYNNKFVIKENPILEEKINDTKINNFFRNEGVKYFLNLIKEELKQVDIKIDFYNFESKFYEKSYINKTLKTLEINNATYQKDGALWLNSSKYGDEKDRVLIKSDGAYTYLLPDIASHYERMIRTKADKFIDFFGADHHGYIKRLLTALSILGTKPNMFNIQIIQMVKLINDNQINKMSKRAGNVIWMKDLLDIFEPSVIKYMFCSTSKSNHLNFDFNKLIQNNENNPVFYAQYASARCSNVLEKAKSLNLLDDLRLETNLLKEEKEKNILIELDSFNNVIKDAAKNFEAHIICDYIQRITKLFHSYYNNFKIIDINNIELSKQRILLIQSFSQVLKNSFDIIGIKFKKKMY